MLDRSLTNAEFDAYNLTGRTNGEDVSASLTPGTADVPHAADAFSFLSHAYIEGYNLAGEYDEAVLNKVINTVTKVIFKNDRFTANVDGTISGVGADRADSNGGFARLAAFDSDLRNRYVRYATKASTYASGVISYEARIHTLGSLAFALTNNR